MFIKNAILYGEDFEPRRGCLAVEGGRIRAMGDALTPLPGEETLDAQGVRLFPGFIDIHIHGGCGAEISAGKAALDGISRRLAACGVTSFCPTTMTAPQAQLEQTARLVAAHMGREAGAYIHGLHLEGPHISMEKRGAQDARFIRSPSLAEAQALAALAPLKLLSMAPETPGALEFSLAFSLACSSRCRISVAHTNADYEQTRAALAAGFSHGTHLFCAMPPLHHRAPGAVGALLEDPTATAELICDGVHLHPATVRLAFRLLGEDRAVAVSDAVSAAGLPEGSHTISGQVLLRQNGAVYLADGTTLAGSSTDLYAEFLNLLAWGIPERAALKSCTINPARVIGVEKETGSLAPGKAADLLLVQEDFTLQAVMIKGKFCCSPT